MRNLIACFTMLICLRVASAQTAPATAPATQKAGRLPHLDVDLKTKTVRMECESINIFGPLEFLVCGTGKNEYESVLRSDARPSHLHLALLMIGLQPGHPIEYDETAKKWLAPSGPALKMSMEFEKDGRTVTIPAEQSMRAMKTKKPMPEVTWVFTGSKIMPDKRYAADATGYLVSVVNFELTPIDFPELESNSNDTLLWETNPDVVPPTGTKVTLIIQPSDKLKPPPPTTAPKTPPVPAAPQPASQPAIPREARG
jgi:hypothetical protein